MTPEPTSLQPGAVAPAAKPEAAAPPAGRTFRIDQRYVAPMLITSILVVGHLTFGILESVWMTALAIVAAISMEMVLGRIMYRQWPHPASAYISGISVGILIRSPFIWPYALCSAIAILSKYVIKVKGRHIWNPSNFAIAMMLLLAHDAVATLSVQWDNRVWAMLVIWVLGSIIISRLKRFHICLVYVLSFLALGVVRSQIAGLPLMTEIAPITGPMYQLFVFFMITDPKTTVHSKGGQMLVAFLVALMEAILRLLAAPMFAPLTGWMQNLGYNPLLLSIHAPYYALFIVGPIANLVEIWQNERKKKQAASAAA